MGDLPHHTHPADILLHNHPLVEDGVKGGEVLDLGACPPSALATVSRHQTDLHPCLEGWADNNVH